MGIRYQVGVYDIKKVEDTMAGEPGGGVARGGDSAPAGRRRINISELAKEEYLQDLERTSTIDAARSRKAARGSDVSSKAAVRDALVISSTAIFLMIAGFYFFAQQIYMGHFEWINTTVAVIGIAFSGIGLVLIMTSMNEIPSYLVKKIQLVFLVAAITVIIPVLSKFVPSLSFSNMPLVFLNVMLAVGIVGATFMHFMKERMAYFIVWWFGVSIVTLAPLYELIDPSSGSGYGGLHKALVASGMTFMLGGLMMAATNRKHYRAMENALEQGDLCLRRRNKVGPPDSPHHPGPGRWGDDGRGGGPLAQQGHRLRQDGQDAGGADQLRDGHLHQRHQRRRLAQQGQRPF
jgi:hypothetical protein